MKPLWSLSRPAWITQPVARLWQRLRDDRGSVTVDSLTAISILALGMTAFALFWSAHQAQLRVTRSAMMMAELLSRQRGVMNRDALDDLLRVVSYVTQSDSRAAMRISQIRRTEGEADQADGRVLDWSYSPCGAYGTVTLSEFSDWLAKLPPMDVGSAILVIEVRNRFTPSRTDLGFEPILFSAMTTALPRYEQSFTLVGEGLKSCG